MEPIFFQSIIERAFIDTTFFIQFKCIQSLSVSNL